jgi:hypothetical protein
MNFEWMALFDRTTIFSQQVNMANEKIVVSSLQAINGKKSKFLPDTIRVDSLALGEYGMEFPSAQYGFAYWRPTDCALPHISSAKNIEPLFVIHTRFSSH